MSVDFKKDATQCCCCDGPLPDIPAVANLPIKISWDFPRWGNFMTKEENCGVALVCDKCDGSVKPEQIKHVIEFRGDHVIYHEIDWQSKTAKP